MGVFDRFERRLERLVEGAFGRVFKGEAAPADIARALQREADDRKVVVGAGRVIAPNAFVVTLGDQDHERLGPYAEALGEAFAEMLHDHAKQAGYSFAGPLRVGLEHDSSLSTGRFQVRSDPAAAPPRRLAEPVPGPVRRAAVVPPPGAAAPPTVLTRPVEETPRRPRHHIVISSDAVGGQGPAEGRTVELVSPVTVLGRSAGVDVQLADPGVSRRHAELHLTGGSLRLLDAGSTNGTTVNGEPVSVRELRSGDRIQMGSTVLVYRVSD